MPYRPGSSRPEKYVGIIVRLLEQMTSEGIQPDSRFDQDELNWMQRKSLTKSLDAYADAWVPDMRDSISTRIRDFLWSHRAVFTKQQVCRGCRIDCIHSYTAAMNRLVRWGQAVKPGYGLAQYKIGVARRKLPNNHKNSERLRKVA